MARRKTKTHFDATQAGDTLRRALCGWLDVETDTDITKVTCASCRRRFAPTVVPTLSEHAFSRYMEESVREGLRVVRDAAVLAPKLYGRTAGPPPRLEPAQWAASCKGAADHRRCGECELCVWEREAERWHAVRPWDKRHAGGLDRPVSAPVWSSLAAAFRALLDWELHDRVSPSAVGAMLERCRDGTSGGKPEGKGDDPLLRRAGDVMPVRLALERAYPPGERDELSSAACMSILLERTLGVPDVMTPYEEIAERHGLSEGDVRSVVKHGRMFVTVELAARGLIPMPRAEDGLAEAVEACRGKLVGNG